jgi:hypothetical protein
LKLVDLDTGPLAGLKEQQQAVRTMPSVQPVRRVPPVRYPYRWQFVFALYLALLLVVLLVCIGLQSLGILPLVAAAPLVFWHIPSSVLLYSLLGGCAGSLVRLNRSHPNNPPGFVMMIWFARPYFGTVLALIAYLLLNAGLFNGAIPFAQHEALYALVSLCVGGSVYWFFHQV